MDSDIFLVARPLQWQNLCGVSSLQLEILLQKKEAAEAPTSKFDVDTDTRYLNRQSSKNQIRLK